MSRDKSISDFTAIDRLCYTGERGMGALEYVPATAEIGDIDENINVREMVCFASEVLNDRKNLPERKKRLHIRSARPSGKFRRRSEGKAFHRVERADERSEFRTIVAWGSVRLLADEI